MYFTRLSAITAALFVFATPTLSDSIDASGTGHGKSTATPMPVSEGVVVVHATSMYDSFDTSDPNNPFASAKGPCFGSIMINKGQVSGEGLCHYTDGDGDIAVIKWVANGISAEGRTQGDWMVEGGTGKWATMTGGGAFDAGGDPYTNNVTGSLKAN